MDAPTREKARGEGREEGVDAPTRGKAREEGRERREEGQDVPARRERRVSPPRIPGNDFGVLNPPAPGTWEPRVAVSVVIPARGGQNKLDLTLAALAAQTYPSHLLEVIVVDDGSAPPLRLPEIAPEHTRIVHGLPGRPGIAGALETGTAVADGEVIHRMDADIVSYRDHVEAHMRWHHLADYLVVTGTLRFTAMAGTPPTAAEVRTAVAGDRARSLFEEDPDHGHDWIGDLLAAHRGFRDAPSPLLHRVHVGATVSLPAALLREAGGMDTSLALGEDTELGYRLTQTGAVFVPDQEALSWHLGVTTAMRRPGEVRRHNDPFIADRVPYRRNLRTDPGRQWLVPYVEVVVDAEDASFEDVRASVDGALASTLADVSVVVTGPWDALSESLPGTPPEGPSTGSAESAESAGSVSSVSSVDSAGSVSFAGPVGPTGSVGPADSLAPADPADSLDPADSVGPAGPVGPVGQDTPLDAPLLDLRLVRGQYANDGRVRFAERVPPTAFPAPFRLVCPAGWVPGAESLAMLVELADKDDEGLLLVALEERETGVVAARFERTAAVARALRVAGDDESLDDVIADLYGATWLDAESWRFRPAARAYPAWASDRNREAVRWRAEAEARTRDAERARRQVAALKAELKELRAQAAKGTRDTARWREKAEQRRLEAVALRQTQQRSLLRRATRRLRRIVEGPR
ncbi:glycosyltransferase family 2 protein [Streptosporangium carneum]|uniref:glycosyltransferase family 2 protein n=1 Tax=Streptosporangium carneum TaxID=47481 RepID=UPI0022F31278|nr:glycosyltransferase family 2 protein [Streptosporangium carneum]